MKSNLTDDALEVRKYCIIPTDDYVSGMLLEVQGKVFRCNNSELRKVFSM